MIEQSVQYKNIIHQNGNRTFTDSIKFTSKSPFKKDDKIPKSNNHIRIHEELESTIDQLKRKIVDMNISMIHLKNQLKTKEICIEGMMKKNKKSNYLSKQNYKSNNKQYVNNIHKSPETKSSKTFSFIEPGSPARNVIRSDSKKKPIIHKIAKAKIIDLNNIVMQKDKTIETLKEKCSKMKVMIVSLENQLSKSNILMPDVISKANEYKSLYESSIIIIESKENEVNEQNIVIERLQNQIKQNEIAWNVKLKNIINTTIKNTSVKWEKILEELKVNKKQEEIKKKEIIDKLVNEINYKEKANCKIETQFEEMKTVFLLKGKEFEKETKENKEKINELTEKLSSYEKRIIETQEIIIQLNSLQKILQIKDENIKRLKAQLNK